MKGKMMRDKSFKSEEFISVLGGDSEDEKNDLDNSGNNCHHLRCCLNFFGIFRTKGGNSKQRGFGIKQLSKVV